MRKLMIPVVLASSLLAAAPAVAQNYRYYDDNRYDNRYEDRYYGGDRDDRYYGGGYNRFDRQIDQLIERIRRAEARDQISQREEDRLMRQARQLNYIENRYSRNGLTRWEAQDLQRRIANLRAQFRWERQDGRYSSRW